MTRKTAALTLGAALALGAALTLAAVAADPEETPKDVGLIERASTRLAQLDVTISGPKAEIEGLTAADFEVRINHKLVPKIFVDDLCVAPPSPTSTSPTEKAPEAASAAEAAKPNLATYLLYFDMSHLTQPGRQGAIEASRDMLPKLLAGGNRAMIVANAADLKTVVPLTTNLAELQAALSKMVNDNSTFDTYATLEEVRMSDIIAEMDHGPIQFAMRLAGRYASEERWRQERDLRRLGMVLGRLAEFDSPKSVLYFADTMRQNAGEHYLAFFNATELQANPTQGSVSDQIQADAAMGSLPLDKVINEASALGIRFYAIEGQGLTVSGSLIQSRGSASGSKFGGMNVASPALNFQRTRDAQNTLNSIAAETGGRSFINGVAPAKMAAQILGDLSCMYLLSFDPSGFPQDEPLMVSVEVKRPKVKANVRGRLVIQSDATRMTARVLAAFASPATSAAASAGVHVGLIPIAYKEGNFKARVQVVMSGTSVPATTWDIGASLVSKGVVRQDGSGRIQVSLPNTPVIYEKDMDFAPGEYDLVAVAHEVQTDTLASKEVHGSWPKLDTELACVGPISVSQPAAGGFLRNGESRTQGAVIVSEEETLRLDTPVAVITLVCRAKDQKRPLRVVRTLYGEQQTPVGTTQLDLSSERCGQVVDLIPPHSLGAGVYRFVITVSSDGNELARGERTLVMPERMPPPAKSSS